jgi:hypothetical protein
MQRIESVVQQLWSRLHKGEKVDVPIWAVEHPSSRPDLFGIPPEAWPMGQHCDFVWRLGDRGRVHAQCFETNGNATVRFHLDKWDPERSLGHAVMHLLFETPAGPAIGAAALLFFAAKARG